MGQFEEFSKGGSPIIRHGEPKKTSKLARGNEQNIEAIGRHIEQHPVPEEMQFKLDQGVDSLWERLEAGGVSELVDLQRKNVAELS